ncbi:hypothetical protein WR25_10684 [Diploscapter pachys]|uniref:Uncharacterized protein n=1 Tax=Diploscapter pachys TaxID=2018661 RepID=A0A2A2LJA4_9BILA|nr:hypothetical protein WR25_10684 [Diploscapter pachys]
MLVLCNVIIIIFIISRFDIIPGQLWQRQHETPLVFGLGLCRRYKLEEREEKEWEDGWKTTDQRKTRQARGGFANLKMRTSLEG